MTRATRRDIRNTAAIDITKYNFNQCKEIKEREQTLDKLMYSVGIYGCNGALYQGRNSGKLYKIGARSSALFFF